MFPKAEAAMFLFLFLGKWVEESPGDITVAFCAPGFLGHRCGEPVLYLRWGQGVLGTRHLLSWLVSSCLFVFVF